MDEMDIHHTVDVPDTPDRLASQRTNERSRNKEANHSSSMPCHSGQQILLEGTKNQPMVIDSGSKKLSLRPQKCLISSMDPGSSAAFGPAGSSSKNTLLFRKGVTEKNPSRRSHNSLSMQQLQMGRPSCTPKSSAFQGHSSVDLAEKNLGGPVFGNARPGGLTGSSQTEFKRRAGIVNGSSSSHGLTKFSPVSGDAAQGTDRVGPSVDNGQGVEFNGHIQNKHGNRDFVSLDSVVSPGVNRQKRLVRNGCISPSNVAKAKQLAGKDIKGSAAFTQNNNVTLASSSPTTSIDIRELVAEDYNSHTGKGKGVIIHPCSPKDLDSKHKHLYGRNSINLNEKAKEATDHLRAAGKSFEGSDGWRSTHNQTRKMNLFPSHEEQLMIKETGASRSSNQSHENRVAGTRKGSAGNSAEFGKDLNLVASSECVLSQPLREPIQNARTRLGRLNGHGSTANTLMKRQKQGSTSNNFGECSTSFSDDPDVVFLCESSEPANLTSTSSSMNAHPVIDIDEFSPESRRNAIDEDARARQVEADELLARELQEQLYHEIPVLRAEEIDAQVAMNFQHQDDADYDLSSAMHTERATRASLASNLRRQSQSRSSSNPPRRGSLARASAMGRMTRLRSRFPGQPRTLLPSRGRASLFPANMDVDMRMHILGAMEAFSDMGVDAGILQTQRDFNENDYEMLLALDENNDRHRGASIRQINGLPQSTVQSDNYEACAVCLETPAIGDTIRHLPCLHKFHKDCIDPWLRRRPSCPVCKSSIT